MAPAPTEYGRETRPLDPADAGAEDHVVQFYRHETELVAAVSHYLARGLRAGEAVFVVSTAAHRRAFERQLALAGIDVERARRSGRLVALDAAATLSQIVSPDGIDGERFTEVIGGLLERTRAAAGAEGRPVRVFGEMVALLWEAGRVPAAIDLEDHWNRLRGRIPFSLFCAYREQSLTGPKHAESLRRICHQHSAVLHHGQHPTSSPRAPVVRQFTAAPDESAAARWFVIQTLEAQGHGDALVHDAALIAGELTANAVVHAHSDFVVTVATGASVVRISVGDVCPTLPIPRRLDELALSGRGLYLVASLACGWGVQRTDGGKVVWAELAR